MKKHIFKACQRAMGIHNRKRKNKFKIWIAGILLSIFFMVSPSGAEMVIIPEDVTGYTAKKENYIPEYEYYMFLLLDELESMGSDSVSAAIPEFEGREEEVLEFAYYIYQTYDYTGKIILAYAAAEGEDELYNLFIQTDNSKELLKMQKAVEDKLIGFSRTLDGLTEREKVIEINNWIASNAVYDMELAKTSCYSNIIEGRSTCNGYARAFLALCSYSGVKCEYVKGYVDEKLHMWNRVKIGGRWEYVDVTWNSMAGINKWLLITEDEMKKDHTNLFVTE